MYFPEFPKKGDAIGICAPSAGVGSWNEKFDASVASLRRAGYRVIETASVRMNGVRSADAGTRAREMNELIRNPEIKTILSATGGDFLLEILPGIDWEAMRKNPKWMCGASDPTSILFALTSKYDIATIYGFNGGSFSRTDDIYTKRALQFLGGSPVRQHTSEWHSDIPDFKPEYRGLDRKTVWKASAGEIEITGRCLGGCIDVLKDLSGTRYDGAQAFSERYKNDGVIWFFDNFSMSAEIFYRTLLEMRYAGWMEHAKAVLVGRVLFPSSDTGMTYGEALERAFPDIPYIYEMDIGHTKPAFTMINGAMLHVCVKDGRGYVDFELK